MSTSMSTSMTRRTARVAGLAAATLCAIGLSGCGSESSTTATAPAAAPPSSMRMSPKMSSEMSPDSADPGMASMIMIQDFTFRTPASVAPGSTVEVMNMDDETHTVTADSGSAFDVTIQPGRTAELTAPTEPGRYPFHCSFHSNMHGMLSVR